MVYLFGAVLGIGLFCFWIRGGYPAAMLVAVIVGLAWFGLASPHFNVDPVATVIAFVGPWVPMAIVRTFRVVQSDFNETNLTTRTGAGFGVATGQDEAFADHARSGVQRPVSLPRRIVRS